MLGFSFPLSLHLSHCLAVVALQAAPRVLEENIIIRIVELCAFVGIDQVVIAS